MEAFLDSHREITGVLTGHSHLTQVFRNTNNQVIVVGAASGDFMTILTMAYGMGKRKWKLGSQYRYGPIENFDDKSIGF